MPSPVARGYRGATAGGDLLLDRVPSDRAGWSPFAGHLCGKHDVEDARPFGHTPGAELVEVHGVRSGNDSG